jgi:nucleoid-associated protein YgaU
MDSQSLKILLAASVVFLGLLFLAPGDVLQAAEPVEHQVVITDDLHLLAGYYYRDPRRWGEIFAANRDKISDPNLIFPGQILTIPGEGMNAFPLPYGEWRQKVKS